MFKQSRTKIIISIMGSLILLFAITLSVILFANYREVRQDNDEMLNRYVDLFRLDSQPEPKGDEPKAPEPKSEGQKSPESGTKKDNRPIEERPDYQLTTFYSVAFSKDGSVREVDNGDKDIYEEETLVETAREILEKGKQSGTKGNLVYVVSERPGYTLVAFLDNTLSESSLDMLLRNILIIGGIAIVVLFFISLFLSKWIIRPLAENDRRQKQFVSDASHELKTPISVIGANAEMLSREVGKNDWLSNILYENERMGNLVKQLLDLSRAENAETLMEQLDISRIVAGEALAFESLAFDQGKTIQSDIEDSIHIKGNRTQLQQLVSVLLDNAVRHSIGKEIEISLKKHSHSAILSVSNEGDEIPPEKLKHLFDRFYRVDEVRNSESNHYGLGLSIAKAIAERHKGRISVSCQEGMVQFTVSLPV